MMVQPPNDRAAPMPTDFLPACRERGCALWYWPDPCDSLTIIVQHGENPEAITRQPRVRPVAPVPWEEARREVLAFVERCHAYEEGA